MKRFFALLLISMMAVTGTFGSIAFAAEAVEPEIQIEAPTIGEIADGTEGTGLFDKHTEDGIMPFSETGIADTTLRIGYSESDDVIVYSYYTKATSTASEIGMSPLQLQKWNSSTGKWENIASGTPLTYNSVTSLKQYTKSPPARKAYYRIIGYHYAKINGQSYTLYNETEAIYVP